MRFSREVKYLGMISDDNLSVINHKKQVCGRLRKANGALCLVRLYVPYPFLRLIYYALFQPHISKPNISRSLRVATLQRIGVRIITFSDYNASSKPLFSQTSILSIHQYVFKLNVMLAYEALNRMSPVAVQQSLRLGYLSDAYVTRDNKKKMLKRLYVRTTKHGILLIRYQSVIHWNILQKHFETTELTSLRG